MAVGKRKARQAGPLFWVEGHKRIDGAHGGLQWELQLACGHSHILRARTATPASGADGASTFLPAPRKARCPTCHPPGMEPRLELHPLLVQYQTLAQEVRAMVAAARISGSPALGAPGQAHLARLEALLSTLADAERAHLASSSSFYVAAE